MSKESSTATGGPAQSKRDKKKELLAAQLRKNLLRRKESLRQHSTKDTE